MTATPDVVTRRTLCQECGRIDPDRPSSGGHATTRGGAPYLCGPVVEIDTDAIDAMRFFAHGDYAVIDWPYGVKWDGEGDPPRWCVDCEQPWPCPGSVIADVLTADSSTA